MAPTPPLPATNADPLRETLAAALGTQYELLAPLGRGAMGTVYLARERFLDRLVAVKALPAELAASSEARERFLREARTAARLTHPNIVPLYSFGEAADTLFYVMGYVDGETLEARLRTSTRIPPDDAARMLAEIADALHYAHEQGVVHRDIKPDNILIDRATGRAMLADFGIAKRGSEGATLTGTRIVLGTPHYMSPEQAAGDRHVDGRSDLYALGVIGFRMLTGRFPFEGGNVMELLAQHMTREAPPIVEPGVSPPLAAAVRRALAKSPDERWPNGRAMRAAVELGDSEDPDEQLPDKLRGAPGFGVRACVAGLVLGQISIAGSIVGSASAFRIFGAAAIVTPVVLFSAMLPAAVRSLGWRGALALAFRKPRSWGGQWPAAGRPHDDVWYRLPNTVRRSRAITGAMVFGSIPLMNAMLWLVSRDAPVAWATIALPAAALTQLGVMLREMLIVRRWAEARGFSMHDVRKFHSEPTSGSSFWRRPAVAALLGPPVDRHSPARMFPQPPADHLRAIDALYSSAAPEHRDLVAEARIAARDLVDAVAECDVELAELARDVAPEERSRIEASVAALGAATDSESDAKRRMRALLGDQLDLLHGLERRRSDVLVRRERLAGHLHALWLALATLRADAALDAAQASEITGRIRAIHREVEIRLAAADEVNALAPGERVAAAVPASRRS